MTLILTPAYGRDYKNKSAVIDDFERDKDFIINDMFGAYKQYDGKPVNKSQLLEDNLKSVNIRYCRLTKVLVHKIKPGIKSDPPKNRKYPINTVGDLLERRKQSYHC